MFLTHDRPRRRMKAGWEPRFCRNRPGAPGHDRSRPNAATRAVGDGPGAASMPAGRQSDAPVAGLLGTGPRKISVSPKCWGSARAGSSTTFRVFAHDGRFGSFRPTVESLHPVSVVVERTNGGCSERIPVGFHRRRPISATAASLRQPGFCGKQPGLCACAQEPGPSRQIARRGRRIRPGAGAPVRRGESISCRRRQRSTRSGSGPRRSVRCRPVTRHRTGSFSEPVLRTSGARPVRELHPVAGRHAEGSKTGTRGRNSVARRKCHLRMAS